ncbi:MAG: HAMP domain-containing protein [Lachnospiraceae bacterium]|jgi:sensor histidine kinase YesM|nr:HAMP domain-containing protein [Lachnospiraceae bacterium]
MESTKKMGSIRRRLVMVFAVTTGVVFLVNMYMYYNINKSISTIDEVYVSNMELNNLIETLADVQKYVYEYLNTKSSDSLENYYRSEQTYRELIDKLNRKVIDDDRMLMQKNIKNMSESYLNTVDDAVNAKRGRNIEKYKVKYEDAFTLYEYIRTYINSLNNEHFKYNSNHYMLLLMSLHYLEVISTAVLLVIMIFNIILIIVVTRSITGPLRNLTEAANEVAAGNFEVDLLQTNSADELEIVTKAFNTMIFSIHEYIIKTKESMELQSKMEQKELMMTNHLKDAQLKYLQAQINPHFLFNTLNAGAQLAMMEGADKTCLFIENMAEFFRFNMKSFDRDSTIGDELKLVDSYIYILNVRFQDGINFYKEVDEEVLDKRVPSMILQPVVENAVNYGIRNIEYEGRIELKVYQERDTILITITDNGAGMDKSTIDRIMNARLQDSAALKAGAVAKDSNGIGLGNVINRLRLYYDREDIFKIESGGPNKGTRVTIYIPKIDLALKADL